MLERFGGGTKGLPLKDEALESCNVGYSEEEELSDWEVADLRFLRTTLKGETPLELDEVSSRNLTGD